MVQLEELSINSISSLALQTAKLIKA